MPTTDKTGKLSNLPKFCLLALIFFNCLGAANCQTDDERYDARLKLCVEQGHRDVNEGVECLENLLKSNPDRGFIHLFLARDYRELSEFDKAEKSIDRFLSLHPSYASGYEVRCQILKDKNDFSGALKACSRAVEIEPDKVDYQRTYASVIEKSGDYSQTETLYKQILTKNPDDQYTLVSLGRLYETTGNTDKAIETYEILFRLDFEFKDKLAQGIRKLREKRESETAKEKNKNTQKQEKVKTKAVGKQ